jgi:hypothetical protein
MIYLRSPAVVPYVFSSLSVMPFSLSISLLFLCTSYIDIVILHCYHELDRRPSPAPLEIQCERYAQGPKAALCKSKVAIPERAACAIAFASIYLQSAAEENQ